VHVVGHPVQLVPTVASRAVIEGFGEVTMSLSLKLSSDANSATILFSSRFATRRSRRLERSQTLAGLLSCWVRTRHSPPEGTAPY
jgi:hypothetical protein